MRIYGQSRSFSLAPLLVLLLGTAQRVGRIGSPSSIHARIALFGPGWRRADQPEYTPGTAGVGDRFEVRGQLAASEDRSGHHRPSAVRALRLREERLALSHRLVARLHSR